ncbi:MULTISPECIES: MFS transporter [Kocuria]|uniref:MFS transporter n=1 Tax=Kocuria TaxID=57493 RepID=UPI0021A54D30|nr:MULTISPECIES: MFS transporter [Kocuria]MCT1544640.1 MFS transporter [Kocuria rhizophila]MCT2171339.1 MFS transporter [Kocuria rhizophila]MDN3461988.1 MFS transporter [Kocuria sp. APC 4018]
MTSPDPEAMDRARIRRARLAVSLLFLTNGAIFSNLLPRLPEFKDMFELSNAAYGLAVIAFPIGGVVAGPLPAPVLRRFGTARTAAAGSVLLAAAVFVTGSVPVLAVFGAGLFVAGVLDAVVDTAQNAQGLRVQRLAGTSMINSMHALWSVGAVIGGLMGTAAAALHVPLAWHFLVSGVVFAAVAVVAMRWAVPDDHEAHAAAQAENLPVDTAGIPRLPRGRRAALLALLPIAVVAVSGVLVEDVGSNWSAVYLRDVLAAPVGLVGLGYVSLVGAQFVGRIVGDRLIDALGAVLVTRIGGVLIFVGLGAVALAPAPWLALVGFALAGFGCATMVPNAYAAADHAPGLKPGTGLTLVSWCMRIVFVLSPPLVGVLADAVGLRTALLIFPVMGVLAFLFAGALRERRRS